MRRHELLRTCRFMFCAIAVVSTYSHISVAADRHTPAPVAPGRYTVLQPGSAISCDTFDSVFLWAGSEIWVEGGFGDSLYGFAIGDSLRSMYKSVLLPQSIHVMPSKIAYKRRKEIAEAMFVAEDRDLFLIRVESSHKPVRDERIQRLIQRWPRQAEFYEWAAFQATNATEQAEFLTRGVALAQETPQLAYKLVALLVTEGSWEQAERTLNKASSLEVWLSDFVRAVIHFEQGNYKEAAHRFKLAIAAVPSHLAVLESVRFKYWCTIGSARAEFANGSNIEEAIDRYNVAIGIGQQLQKREKLVAYEELAWVLAIADTRSDRWRELMSHVENEKAFAGTKSVLLDLSASLKIAQKGEVREAVEFLHRQRDMFHRDIEDVALVAALIERLHRSQVPSLMDRTYNPVPSSQRISSRWPILIDFGSNWNVFGAAVTTTISH